MGERAEELVQRLAEAHPEALPEAADAVLAYITRLEKRLEEGEEIIADMEADGVFPPYGERCPCAFCRAREWLEGGAG